MACVIRLRSALDVGQEVCEQACRGDIAEQLVIDGLVYKLDGGCDAATAAGLPPQAGSPFSACTAMPRRASSASRSR